jgi:hypothetical protein
MKNVLYLLVWIPGLLFAQPAVDKAGDGWDLEVYKALHLIQKTSPTQYQNIVRYVEKIEFWNENYSSNDGKGVIVIAAKDIKLGSTNNIAAVLVHESCHIILNEFKLSPKKEEIECYVYELVFLKKLPNVEPELIKHCINQIETL